METSLASLHRNISILLFSKQRDKFVPLFHPPVGRIAEHGLPNLVIALGRTSYVGQDRFDAARDAVVVLAIRHQDELDIANEAPCGFVASSDNANS